MIAGFAGGAGRRPAAGDRHRRHRDDRRRPGRRWDGSPATPPTLIGLGRDLRDDEITVLEGWAGDLYGMPVHSTLDAIRLTGQLEGMIIDPVYEGKSMAGLIDLVRNGDIGPDSTVLYAHLGGQPALNAYSGLFPTPQRPPSEVSLVRPLVLVAVVAAYFAFGPWVLVAALLALLVPRGPPRAASDVAVSLAVLVVDAGVVPRAGDPGRRLPIPPGGGLLVTKSFGGPVNPDPITLATAAAPAPGGQREELHAQRRLGDRCVRGTRPARPRSRGRLGVVRRQGVRHARVRLRDARLVGLCGRAGPVMHVIDPESMDPLDDLGCPSDKATPANGRGRTCAGAPTSTSTRTTRRSSAPPTDGSWWSPGHAEGEADLTVEETVDLTGVIPEDDCLVALMPDWQGGHLVGQPGRPGRPGDAGWRVQRPGPRRGDRQLGRRRRGRPVRRHRRGALQLVGRGAARAPRSGGMRRTTAAARRSRASSVPAAVRPRRCCRAGWWRSPTTPSRG